jgi:hypothetical protein
MTGPVADPPPELVDARPARLVAIEAEAAWYVSWSASPADWIAEFRKGPVADARAWALGMARAYNGRSLDRLDKPDEKRTA